jgi:hypothetical protein
MTHRFLPLLAILALTAGPSFSEGAHAVDQEGAIRSDADAAKTASFDILAAHAHREGNVATFHMTTNGIAGADVPMATGALGGAEVLSYVWPTSLDPSSVGLKAAQASLHWRQPAIRTLTTRHCLMRIWTATRQTMALSGTATGSF